MKNLEYILEEKDEFMTNSFEEFGTWKNLKEVKSVLKRLRKDWPASEWRIVEVTRKVLDV